MLRRIAPPARHVAFAVFAVLFIAGCSTTPRSAPVTDRSIGAGVKPAAVQPAPRPDGNTYVVKRGDTLRSISAQFSMDYRQLAALNSIDPPYQIHIDQVLRVSADTAPANPVAQSAPVANGTVEQRALGAPATEAPAEGAVKTSPSGMKQPYSDATLSAMAAPDGSAGVAPAPASQAAPAAGAALSADEDLGWIWPASGNVVAEFTKEDKGIDIAGKAGAPVLAAADGTVIYVGGGANSLRGYGNLVIVKHNAMFLSVYAHNSKNLVTENQAVKKGQKIAEMGDTDADHVALHFEIRRQGTPVNPVKYLPPH